MPDLRPDSDPLAPLRQTLAGHYEILRQLGQGAFATVYLARDLRHERQVAIKVLNLDPSSELPEMRFLREIRVLAGLQHPNILPLYDSGHVADRLYYVMPYVAGESLRDRIARERRMALAPALRMTCELADALAYAHRSGVIHRDIKPENILLSGTHAMLCDFGIARALDAVRFRQLTRTDGVSPGTPAYMSPEQLLGQNVVDGRSDIYSLGCVLYEMLAGQPPFSGPSGFARRFTEAPPHVSTVRPDVPASVDRLLSRVLATEAAARLATADELKEAVEGVLRELEPHALPPVIAPPSQANEFATPEAPATRRVQQPEMPSPTPTSGVALGRLQSRPRRLATLAITLIVGGVVVARGTGGPGEAEGAELPMVVLVGEQPDGMLDSLGVRPDLLLHDAFARWRDVRLVSTLRVDDAVARFGRAPRSVDDGTTLARDLGAGRLVWAKPERIGDSLEIRAQLIDLRGRRSRLGPEQRVRVPIATADLRAPFALLASKLLSDEGTGTTSAAASTSSLAAWQAYDGAHRALAHWDVATAERQLRLAVQLDPEFPQPALWLAQLMMWTGSAERQRGQWHAYATRAAERRQALSESEAAHADAIVAIAEGRYPEACEAARALVERDRLDFAAWYLLGECHRLDRTVLPDTASPSGWRFRTSYHTAIDAYERAMELLPSLHFALGDLALERLRRLLYNDISRFRPGSSAGPDSLSFIAFPALREDTLAMVPYPAAQMLSGAAPTPSTISAAVERNRAILRRIAQGWATAYPGSAIAREALAEAIEATGEIGDERTGALAEVRAARLLASNPVKRVRMAASEVRLLLKLGRWRAAKVLADSLLSARLPADPATDSLLAGVAALTGRVDETTARLRSSGAIREFFAPGGATVRPPTPVTDAAAEVLVYAALGLPSDSLDRAIQELERLLGAYVPPGARASVRSAVLAQAITAADPLPRRELVARIDPSVSTIVRLRQRVMAGDAALAAAELAALEQRRRAWLPGSVTIDARRAEARLYLTLGDTAQAVDRLTSALDALPTLRVGFLESVAEVGSLVRAMALRAELAHHLGEDATARRWASAVATLWSDADSELQPMVLAMREMVAAPPQ